MSINVSCTMREPRLHTIRNGEHVGLVDNGDAGLPLVIGSSYGSSPFRLRESLDQSTSAFSCAAALIRSE